MDLQFDLKADPVDAAHPVEPLAVEPDTPLGDVLALMKLQKTGSLLVCRDAVLVGIFTERDALRWMADGGELDVPIERLMTRNPATLLAGAKVAEAVKIMSQGGYRRLPVMDGAKPVGMLSMRDFVRFIVSLFPRASLNLPPNHSHP